MFHFVVFLYLPFKCLMKECVVLLQKSMKKLLYNGTILVGHSLYNDLRGKCHEHFVWLSLNGPLLISL